MISVAIAKDLDVQAICAQGPTQEPIIILREGAVITAEFAAHLTAVIAAQSDDSYDRLDSFVDGVEVGDYIAQAVADQGPAAVIAAIEERITTELRGTARPDSSSVRGDKENLGYVRGLMLVANVARSASQSMTS
ncbi:hypothetical protein [Frankia sp. Cr1]|uniref:hypothetical protein n=1 Tax=Frankia sp. Cr1 TaxID=3073931 RepID=UPI002AD3AE0C|nr:hypothetical protein [Frankia sp. Cr1]